MTLTFDQSVYHSLLTEVTPVAIETEVEYQRLLKIAEQLTFKKNRTKEELALHKLLVVLIEAYETENCPMKESRPHQVLLHIMEASGTSQTDLVGLIGSSEVVSQVVNGERAIDELQAKALGKHFKVAPSLFI
ncbi:transcriptional regulator [Calothrix sp. HK-06]|nr:transcriptional regulator [Calothrix sp. HK-06]